MRENTRHFNAYTLSSMCVLQLSRALATVTYPQIFLELSGTATYVQPFNMKKKTYSHLTLTYSHFKIRHFNVYKWISMRVSTRHFNVYKYSSLPATCFHAKNKNLTEALARCTEPSCQ